MISHAGFVCEMRSTSSHDSASPPRIKYFLGRISPFDSAESRALKCDGTIFKTSIGRLLTYRENSMPSIATSLLMRCRQPPDTNAGKMHVLPRSAVIVETVAK